MAEIIGLIASIQTIAAAGLIAARTISMVVDDLGGAGAEIKGIGIDLRAMVLVLHELKKRLDKMEKATDEVRDLACQILAVCKADIRDIEEFLKPLVSRSGKEFGLRQKMCWLFAKAKVSTRRAHLETFKSTLNLFIIALDFIENGTIEDYIREEVQALLNETQHNKTTLLMAERSKAPFRSEVEALSSKKLQIENEQSIKESDLPPVVDNTGNETSPNETKDEENRSMILSNRGSITKATEFLESISDEDFIQIAEHVRLQNKVRDFTISIIYPRARQQNRDDQFEDEQLRRSYEWQDGYDASYVRPVSRSEEDVFSESDLKLELRNAKTELKAREILVEQLNKRIAQLNEHVERFRLEHAVHEESEKWRERENQARKDAEEDFRQRYSTGIENARIEAEKRTRDWLETERLAEEGRTKREEEVMRQAKKAARLDYEEELQAAEKRGKEEAEERVRAEREARLNFEAELYAAEDKRIKDEEERKRAEELARVRFEKALQIEAEAKAVARKKVEEEAERLIRAKYEARAITAKKITHWLMPWRG
ncbi:hypothetical protein ACHAPA_009391 [Fusarium lateritium]